MMVVNGMGVDFINEFNKRYEISQALTPIRFSSVFLILNDEQKHLTNM